MNCNYTVGLNEHASWGWLREASPCPGLRLFSQHRNGTSLAVVMRFLTLGSTLSTPNQPPKIISTGNAFLTSKNWSPNSLNWIFSLFCRCVCACVSVYGVAIFCRLWFRHYKMAEDTSEDYFLNVAEVRGATSRWPISFFPKSAVHCYSARRGWWKGGWDGWMEKVVVGGGERAGSDELEPKRKTHSFSSAGREGGNSQLCRHNMTTDVGCEVQSCCDRQAAEEEKEPPPPNYLPAQERTRDWGCAQKETRLSLARTHAQREVIPSDGRIFSCHVHGSSPSGCRAERRSVRRPPPLSPFPPFLRFDSIFPVLPLSWHPQ